MSMLWIAISTIVIAGILAFLAYSYEFPPFNKDDRNKNLSLSEEELGRLFVAEKSDPVKWSEYRDKYQLADPLAYKHYRSSLEDLKSTPDQWNNFLERCARILVGEDPDPSTQSFL